MQGDTWTFNEIDYVYKHYNTDGVESVSTELNRSVSSVRCKAEKLNLKSCGDFTRSELNYASTYAKSLGTALTFLLPNRTSHEVEELIKCKSCYQC